MNEWIPTHEKLPDEDGRYIVTWLTYEEVYVDIMNYGYPDKHYKEKCFYNWDYGCLFLFTPIVTAWMPLPEAY